jgi:hypothetical protein
MDRRTNIVRWQACCYYEESIMLIRWGMFWLPTARPLLLAHHWRGQPVSLALLLLLLLQDQPHEPGQPSG